MCFFDLVHGKNPHLLAGAFGVRDVFKVVSLGEVRENRAIRQLGRLAHCHFLRSFLNGGRS